MFSKYFISTLVFIIVSLAVLFQGEIKEGYSSMSGFGPWSADTAFKTIKGSGTTRTLGSHTHPRHDEIVEAKRSMQPFNAPPRIQPYGTPRLLKHNMYPDKLASYPSDPIYPSGQLYTSSGQVLENHEKKMGRPKQEHVIDRLMHSNSRSRYQRGGVDRIRGDIHIKPDISKGGNQWFQVAASEQDLVRGYIPAQHIPLGKMYDCQGLDERVFDTLSSADATFGTSVGMQVRNSPTSIMNATDVEVGSDTIMGPIMGQ